jgi:hypothetical protein
MLHFTLHVLSIDLVFNTLICIGLLASLDFILFDPVKLQIGRVILI